MSDGSFRVTALFDNEEATKTVAAPLIAMPTTENALVPVSMADRSVTLHIPTDDDISARAHTDGGKASSITDRLLAQHKSRFYEPDQT